MPITEPTCVITVRIPESMRTALREAAFIGEMSMNSWCVETLKAALARVRIGQPATIDDSMRTVHLLSALEWRMIEDSLDVNKEYWNDEGDGRPALLLEKLRAIVSANECSLIDGATAKDEVNWPPPTNGAA